MKKMADIMAVIITLSLITIAVATVIEAANPAIKLECYRGH